MGIGTPDSENAGFVALELANWSDKRHTSDTVLDLIWPPGGVEVAEILQDNIKNVKDSHLAIIWIGMIPPPPQPNIFEICPSYLKKVL